MLEVTNRAANGNYNIGDFLANPFCCSKTILRAIVTIVETGTVCQIASECSKRITGQRGVRSRSRGPACRDVRIHHGLLIV